MKKLLLSVIALMVATLLFSLDDSLEVQEDVSQDNNIEMTKKSENAS
ncbi:MAG: hypothetical protein HKN00_14415 [Flavobacteriaceae bacterium]|nr:hypothetical protein [Bacteroidia bacterium]MBT8286541.1 hypothetical protein [Bacteroidia bacterium]NNF76376.1 hypothetical protein [Flavobacteriaceae bacterium]NNK72046.1 hypothetical protein [Flavobacteriaceae bacterium]